MNEARGQCADFFARLWRQKPLGIVSGIVILILILLAIFADVLAPYPFDQLSLAERLQGSSARHLLGTDQLGRDLLSRLLFGARISLVVGFAATTLNVVVATVIGGTSGFVGGKLDLAVQRFVDAWMAFPGLLLLLTIMSIAGRGLPQIIVVLGIAGGVGGSRVVRGAVVATKGNDYFLAAKALGAPTTQILVRHVLPNIVAPLIIVFSINVGGVILAEASLSFLGFGLPNKVPSWGGMLSREGRRFMEQAPWLALWPGLCLTIVVYSFNMLGDAMRDLLDPRLRGGGGRVDTGGTWQSGELSRCGLMRQHAQMADTLSGKVAIITGGNSGIGEGIGRAFAAEGAKVILMARREQQGRAVAARIQEEGGTATFIACDVSAVASVEAAVAAAAKTYGAVDILINNAGGGGGGTFPDETTEQFNRIVHLNLMGTFYMSRAVWPHLISAGGGAVVNMSSLAAQRGFSPRMLDEFGVASCSYYAAKAGVDALTRFMAGVGGKHNIRVNGIRPGQIMTPGATRGTINDADGGHHVFESMFDFAQIVKGPGYPEDVANLALFLASEQSRFINGETVNIDGGVAAKL